MIFFENFVIALRAIRANALRSILTTVGIIIGTAAVIAVVSIVQGLQYLIVGQLQSVGSTHIIVLPQQERNQGPGFVARQVRLTWEDGQAIRDRVPGIAEITPVVAGNVQLKYRDRQHDSMVIGCHDNWPEIFNYGVERGRFFSRFDVDSRRKVAVVGPKVVDELRLGEKPIGKEIYVGKVRATIIGVMEKKGQSLGQDFDDITFIPFETALLQFGRAAGDQIQLRLQAASADTIEQVTDGVTHLLRQRHHLSEGEKDDFQILKQDQILSAVNAILGGVTAVVGGVVGVALLVGGIGIMNIMLVSVTERTREIGVRKSVGARRHDVLIQFLIEAVTLSLVGGVLGVALGYGLGALVVALVPVDLPPVHVPWWAVLIAFGFSCVVGVVFGIYPAGKAAALDPIEALRYE
jgi:putative ABC transport system permease protein